MTPHEVAWVDQFRADLKKIVTVECTCGECLTNAEIQRLLAMPDAELLELMQSASL